jgi:putative flippase GtrA
MTAQDSSRAGYAAPGALLRPVAASRDRGDEPGVRAAPSTPARHDRRSRAVRQVGMFAAIGVASTLAYVAFYALLRTVSPADAANAVALVVTAIGNTAANRHLTFNVRGRDGIARDHLAGLVALGVALAITSASLATLGLVAPRAGRMVEVAVLVAANALATLVRFLLLRLAMGRGPDDGAAHVPVR